MKSNYMYSDRTGNKKMTILGATNTTNMNEGTDEQVSKQMYECTNQLKTQALCRKEE